MKSPGTQTNKQVFKKNFFKGHSLIHSQQNWNLTQGISHWQWCYFLTYSTRWTFLITVISSSGTILFFFPGPGSIPESRGKHRNCVREMGAKMAEGQWHRCVQMCAVGGQATQALSCLCAGSTGCDCSICVCAEAQGHVGEDRLQGKREQWGCWSILMCDTGTKNLPHRMRGKSNPPISTKHRAQQTWLSRSFLFCLRGASASSLVGRGF